jgi:hypothetical protein
MGKLRFSQGRSEAEFILTLTGSLFALHLHLKRKKEKNLHLAIDIQFNNNLFNQSSISGRFLARNVFFILKRIRDVISI